MMEDQKTERKIEWKGQEGRKAGMEGNRQGGGGGDVLVGGSERGGGGENIIEKRTENVRWKRLGGEEVFDREESGREKD